jgi:16S rRNA (cytosine967-C5)-methyltransferase
MVTARAAALQALVALDRGHAERIRDVLDAAGLAGREQALAYELAHGVLRRERLLDHVLLAFAHRGLPKDATQRAVLRLGAYQLLFASGMPVHAAVHETVDLVRSNKGFTNAMLRRLADCLEARPADPARPTLELALSPSRCLRLPTPLPDNESERLGIVHSLPFFLLQRWSKDLDLEGLRRVAAAASSVPGVFLRAVGCQRDELQAELAAAGVITHPAAHPGLLRWTDGPSPFGTASFRAGRFLVQDGTALSAAEAVPCGPGDLVLDLCAAPGTKTTLLAERVRPGGKVYAYDLDPARRQRIRSGLERLKLGDAVQVVETTADLPLFDAVLVDVPCSNTGVLGRRVEVRRRLTGGTFGRMVSEQRSLLVQALSRCRPGGAVVYSTCSIDREENEHLVRTVLESASTPPATLAAEHRTLPLAGEHDGGYWALLRRALPAAATAE